MKALPEKLAEQYADDKSKRYYIGENGEKKWYITARGQYSKEDFLAGYQAAKVETNLPTSAKWISVKDRLPEDRESVIYWHDLHGTNIGHYDSTFPKPNYHWWSYHYGDHADFRVQWWMPLPKIPEAPKEEK